MSRERVVNRTRGTVLAERCRRAESYLTRGVGLLGQASLPAGEGLWIAPCRSIHSLFMRFSFDACFLDGSYQVIHVIHQMRPWRLSRHLFRAQGVLELPAGTLATTGTAVGDMLAFE